MAAQFVCRIAPGGWGNLEGLSKGRAAGALRIGEAVAMADEVEADLESGIDADIDAVVDTLEACE